MSEFIEQFILESRELVEHANAALVALERSPQDAERVDETFRAIHTLKGGAAIVDFFAMERALHAAEDALSAVRSGKRSMTIGLVADCFACLDQVSRWLDTMAQSGELPAGADSQADTLIARVAGVGVQSNVRPDRSHENLPSHLRTVVRFTAPSDSFFRGEDPLALIAALPGLQSLELAPVDRWPALEELDPFECRLVVTAFSSASADDVGAHFQGREGECEIRTLHSDAASILTEHSRKLLEAQMALLDETQAATFVGRVASAGRVAANVLRCCRQVAAADLIALETERSLRENSAAALRTAITRILTPTLEDAAPVTAALSQTSQLESAVRNLRVDAQRVDELVRLTAELTVVKNALGHVLKFAEDNDNAPVKVVANALKRPQGDLDHLIGELQRAVLSIRVLPLRFVLQRLPRLVREISATLDKPAQLLIEGDDTEADKAIVEMLFEPLLHIVRNALDHGIEVPKIRSEHNKPAVATLRIRASRQGSHVLVEVEDDGGGVDVARVREVARQRAVASPETLDAMSDEEIIQLVFAAGFSTAAEVTGLSGRGVGMDAVRTAVERVGGRVVMESRAGVGTVVKLMLPFSVMLTRVMTVEAGGQMFGIPLDAVVETISVPQENIVGIGAARAIVRRDRTVPVFELAGLLQGREQRFATDEAIIVVATIAGQLGGLRVDHVGERMEVMLKPLDGLLTNLPGIAGTTILGDGRVLLVLDLAEVLQ